MVQLEIENVDLVEGSLEIYMENFVELIAIQYSMSGVLIDSVDNGSTGLNSLQSSTAVHFSDFVPEFLVGYINGKHQQFPELN